MTFVIFLTGGRMLAHNRHPMPESGFKSGWRPFVWTDALIDAEQFCTREGAQRYARQVMPHEDWAAICISGEEVVL